MDLEDFTLHNLSGGQSPRDVKRAVALVDTGGSPFFLVASNDAEYFSWLRGLDSVSGTKPDCGSQLREEKCLAQGGNVDDVSDEDSVATTESESNIGFRTRIATVGQATKKGFDLTKQVTKSRLGSALQAAREKGKEVVEKQRRLVAQHEAQSTLFSHTSSRVDVQIKNNAVHESGNDASSAKKKISYWTCSKCTYINSNETACEMCGNPTEVSNPSNDVESDDEQSLSSGNKGGVRQRLGAAVLRARDGVRGSQPTSLPDGSQSSSQLRAVSICSGTATLSNHPVYVESIENFQEWRVLDGSWSAKVSRIFSSFDGQKHNDGGENDGQGTTDPSVECTQSSSFCNMKFRVTTINHEARSVPVEIERDLEDVLSLHLTLSGAMDSTPNSDLGGASPSNEASAFTSLFENMKSSAGFLEGLLRYQRLAERSSVCEYLGMSVQFALFLLTPPQCKSSQAFSIPR